MDTYQEDKMIKEYMIKNELMVTGYEHIITTITKAGIMKTRLLVSFCNDDDPNWKKL